MALKANKKGPPEDDPFANIQPKAYSFTLSFSAFAMVILTTLSASFHKSLNRLVKRATLAGSAVRYRPV